MDRASGALLPIFSLPGPYGIGTIGKEAYNFAELLTKSGIRYWQILPLGHTGAENSPYQCFSGFAGNPYFIDLDQLASQELLTAEELLSAHYSGQQNSIDYGWLWKTRLDLLLRAHSRIDKSAQRALSEFIEENEYWLIPYANFMTIKRHFAYAPWWKWPYSLKMAEPDAVNDFVSERCDIFYFYCYLQYIFFTQWQHCKQLVNELGVDIIGDIPFYTATDSAAVWSRPELFELDEGKNVIRVSGVPPDYFSTTGQLWNNPIYAWNKMAKDDYSYWYRLLSYSLQIYDVVRIDHFRGFESYWAIPAGSATAENGQWEKGPAMDLFGPLLQNLPSTRIIAEDLGEITTAVRKFLNDTGLPGMKVLQFAFNPDLVSRDRPHSYTNELVAFSGTHDNNTLSGWLADCSEAEWALVRDYFGLMDEDRKQGGVDSPAIRTIIRTLWQSSAGLTICPVQDMLGLGADYRINTPGSSKNNWLARLTKEQLAQIDTNWFYRLNEVTQRLTKR